jgi:peptidyl-prolyl cis-trans isomerase D
MRKHAKSWLIKFFVAIIALVFIFYFGYSFRAREGLKVAYVNGELISGHEYGKAYHELVEAYRNRYKGIWNEGLIKSLNLKGRVLESLINQKLISQEAKRLGLEVTEEEVQQAIMEYPAFQVGGKFYMGRYQALLSQNRMKPEDFEAAMAEDLLDRKLKQFLFAFMAVTEQEAQDRYTYEKEKKKVAFVRFKPDDYKQSITLDESAMKAFYEKGKEKYRVPETIKIGYLEIDPQAFKDKAKVTELEIKEHYEYSRSSYSVPAQVKARHILFKLDDKAKEKEERRVREVAKKVLEQAKKGKDFAALAKRYSEGPSKDKGGDLGYFSKGKMVKPFETAAFSLKKGEISELVRTRFGYHIIKVEDVKEARTKPLEEVRDQIKQKLLKSVCSDLAHEKGLSLLDQMPYDVDLATYAAEHGFKVRYTSYFSQQQPIPVVGGSAALRKALFSLEGKETSELSEIGGKFYIFQVADRKPSYVPKMDAVAKQVKADFTDHLAAQKAKQVAEAYLAELRGGKDWAALATEKKLKPQETDFFTRSDPIKAMGNAPELKEAIFGLNESKPYPERIFQNDKGAFVIKWVADKGIDAGEYGKAKETYQFSFMQAKHQRVFMNWLGNLRKRAEIEIVTPVTDR